MYQVGQAVDGWIDANSLSDDGNLPEDQAQEIWEWMKTKPPVPLTLKDAGKLKANGGGT